MPAETPASGGFVPDLRELLERDAYREERAAVGMELPDFASKVPEGTTPEQSKLYLDHLLAKAQAGQGDELDPLDLDNPDADPFGEE